MNIDLDFKMIDDPSIKLTYFGEYLYDNIIFAAPSFTPEYTYKGDVKIQNFVKFFDDGHDIMIFGGTENGSFIRSLVNEFGSDFDNYVLNHF